MKALLIQAAGTAVVLAALVDIYLTVLYARAGVAVFSHWIGPALWSLFRHLARPFPAARHRIFSFCGPTILVVMVGVWIILLIGGFALIVWPALGHHVQAVRNNTPTDFGTAVYFAGYCFTTIGNGDIVPTSTGFRLLAVFVAVVGVCVMTLVITYYLQVYNALHRRNTLALMVYHATGDTADAAEFLARVGNGGDADAVRDELNALSKSLFSFHESHHFYGSLQYFHFPEPYYAPSWIVTTLMDSVTLIRSALDEKEYGRLQRCAATSQLWDGGMHLLRELSKTILPARKQPEPDGADPDTRAAWRRRFHEAAARLRDADIATTPDEAAGADKYVALRAMWEPYVRSFAAYLEQPPTSDAARRRSDEPGKPDAAPDDGDPASTPEPLQHKRAG